MKHIRPILLALLVCLSGVLLMPITPFATDLVNWHSLSGAYLFTDGFESGDTGQWSTTMSNNQVVIILKHGSPLAEEILNSADGYGHCVIPRRALNSFNGNGLPDGEAIVGFNCDFLLRQDALEVRFSLRAQPTLGVPPVQ